MQASSFVDWIQGSTEEAIATRRYAFYHSYNRNVSEHLKHYVGGRYTDDEGKFMSKKRDRPDYDDQ